MSNHEQFMHAAIAAAHHSAELGDYALAALVVKDGVVIAEGRTTLHLSVDPTAHGEINAIRAACEKLGSKYLPGCVLYSTQEPCSMCASAAIWAKMDGVVFGASIADARAYAEANPSPNFSWRQIELPCADVLARGNPKLTCEGGVLREECIALFSLSK